MATYTEIPPARELRPFVECYWVLAGRVDPFDVLPDGCVDFLFEGGSRPRAMLIGAMTRPLPVPALASASMVAVRFHPGAARRFVEVDFTEFTDSGALLGDLASPHRELEDAVFGARTPAERVRAIEAWLLARLPAGIDAIDAALAALRARSGRARIDELADEVSVSRQWLAQKVRERTGLSPKLLARILRLRAVGRDAAGCGSLASVAARHGFADQAHLARDVRAILGRTPSEWLLGFHSSKTRAAANGTVRA